MRSSNAPGRSWSATRCALRLAHSVRSSAVLTSSRLTSARPRSLPPLFVCAVVACWTGRCAHLTTPSCRRCSADRPSSTPRRASPPWGGDGRSRLAPFASWRSRCSRHASLAPSRCASSQVWLRLRPWRAFAFPSLVPLRSLGHLLVTSSARQRARDSRPGHGPAVRAGPRTTLALAAQVPAHGARGWMLHSR